MLHDQHTVVQHSIIYNINLHFGTHLDLRIRLGTLD